MNKEDLCEAGRFTSLPEAEIVRSYLENHGVAAFVPDVHMSTLLSYAMLTSSGGVRVLINRKDLARARELLSEAPLVSELSSPVAETALLRFYQTAVLSIILPFAAHFFAYSRLASLVLRERSSLRKPRFFYALLILAVSSFAYASLLVRLLGH